MTGQKKVDFKKITQSTIIEALKRRYGDPLPREMIKFIDVTSSNKFRKIKQEQGDQLIKFLHSDVKEIQKDINSKEINNYDRKFFSFWVNLYCFFTDYEEYYKPHLKFLEEFVSSLPSLQAEIVLTKDILDLHNSVKNLFTKEDLIFIEYQRHRKAHMQKKYSPPTLTEFVKSENEADIKKDLDRIKSFFERKEAVDKIWNKEEIDQQTKNPIKIEKSIAIKYSKKLLGSSDFETLKKKQLNLTALLYPE